MRQRVWLAVVGLVVCLVLQAGLAVRQQSLTWDEGNHLYSGYCNWTRGEYTNNPEHPPLAKLVAALPLLPLHLKLPPRQGRFFKAEAYWGGTAMIYQNGQYSADEILIRARLAMLVFSVGLALMLFFAGREMFGVTAGLIAMGIYCFDTTVLAHAPLVTTDTAGACGFFAAIYTLYRYVKRPTAARLVMAGLGSGLALVSKHSAVLLVPIVLLLLAGEVAGRAWARRSGKVWGEVEARANARQDVLRLAAGFVGVALVAWFVMWAVYGFRFAMHPHGAVMPDVKYAAEDLGRFRSGVILFLLRHKVLPESYLYGLVDVLHVGDLMPSYLFGKVYAHGVWYFFPVVLAMKWTLAFLVMLVLGLFALVTGRVERKREVWFLGGAALVFLATAMSSPLAIGIRHVLPLFGFVFLLTAAGLGALIARDKRWVWAVAVLLIWHAGDSLRMFPNYFPYSNALWGGPTKTWTHVADSTVDWGQELKAVKKYTDTHGIQQCHFAYFLMPFVDPHFYGIPCEPLPTPDTMFGDVRMDVPEVVSGTLLINTSDLSGFEMGSSVMNPYQQLVGRQPDDVILGEVAVFHGNFNFPLTRSMRYETESGALLKNGDNDGALAAAEKALAIAPDGFFANLAKADALAAMGRKDEALAQYVVVQGIVEGRMEPSAKAYWLDALQDRRDGMDDAK